MEITAGPCGRRLEHAVLLAVKPLRAIANPAFGATADLHLNSESSRPDFELVIRTVVGTAQIIAGLVTARLSSTLTAHKILNVEAAART